MFIFPPQAEYAHRDFDFRISSATIEVEESDFTSLPDYKRLLAVLEGKMELIHTDKYSKQLIPFESDSFHGSWTTKSKGKVRDFNVIYSDKYALKFEKIETDESISITKSSDFLFLFILDHSTLEENPFKRYNLVEVMDAELFKIKGLFFKIELFESPRP